MQQATYFLSSLDSERFAPVRECRFIRVVSVGDKPAMFVSVTPGILGQDFGSPEMLGELILTTRFEGDDIRAISDFPCFVFIALQKGELTDGLSRIRAEDLEIVGWGELYRTAADATAHTFDT